MQAPVGLPVSGSLHRTHFSRSLASGRSKGSCPLAPESPAGSPARRRRRLPTGSRRRTEKRSLESRASASGHTSSSSSRCPRRGSPRSTSAPRARGDAFPPRLRAVGCSSRGTRRAPASERRWPRYCTHRSPRRRWGRSRGRKGRLAHRQVACESLPAWLDTRGRHCEEGSAPHRCRRRRTSEERSRSRASPAGRRGRSRTRTSRAARRPLATRSAPSGGRTCRRLRNTTQKPSRARSGGHRPTCCTHRSPRRRAGRSRVRTTSPAAQVACGSLLASLDTREGTSTGSDPRRRHRSMHTPRGGT